MTDIAIIGLNVLILLGFGSIYVFRKFLFSYSSEKGKNLATKEDIEEITNKIENVKLEYAKQLESARAELSSQINTHGFRYEKEFEVLESLTSNLVELRNTVLNLRPALDYVDPSKSSDEIKQERLLAFNKARRELFFVREKKRPFFPNDIYEAILEIDKAASSESIDYQYGDPHQQGQFRDYWDKAEKNQKDIIDKTNLAIEKIRERIKKWESLA